VSFNHHALIARIGNEQGAREEFARLVAALGELTTQVRRIRENPGDWGIDAFAGRLGDGADVAVWQAKFFINGVGQSQQQQIRDSFRMAREAAEKHGYQLVRWTLVIPVDLSATETQWWDGWKEREQAEHGVMIELWDKHRLDTLLRPPDAEAIRRKLLPRPDRPRHEGRARLPRRDGAPRLWPLPLGRDRRQARSPWPRERRSYPRPPDREGPHLQPLLRPERVHRAPVRHLHPAKLPARGGASR
jgi:hypothetical protein